MSVHARSSLQSLAAPMDVSGFGEVDVYAEGILAGVLGAIAIAVWFLVIDIIQGQPLHTPMVLGTTLFGGHDPGAPTAFETVVSFTGVHTLVFLLIGMALAKLVDVAERDPDVGFGVVLLFVLFQFGFLAVSMSVASDVLGLLAWPEVMGGNLIAAGTMATVLWRRHPRLVIAP